MPSSSSSYALVIWKFKATFVFPSPHCVVAAKSSHFVLLLRIFCLVPKGRFGCLKKIRAYTFSPIATSDNVNWPHYLVIWGHTCVTYFPVSTFIAYLMVWMWCFFFFSRKQLNKATNFPWYYAKPMLWEVSELKYLWTILIWFRLTMESGSAFRSGSNQVYKRNWKRLCNWVNKI